MRRGILFALLAAGVIAVCLATSLNHPVTTAASNDAVPHFGYYYNEDGALIHIDSNAEEEGYFVIKTKRTRKQMFPDWYERDTSQVSKDYSPAAVCSITPKVARLVEALIRRKALDDVLVGNNIVAILDKGTIQKLLDTIRDSGMNTDTATDFKEYGGIVRGNHTFTFKMGKSSNPCDSINWGVKPGGGGIADYHSHPSGLKDGVNKHGDSIICSFVQGVSRQDQSEVHSNRKGYVFGMRKGYHRIYIYDSTGIIATLPFEYLKSEYNNK